MSTPETPDDSISETYIEENYLKDQKKHKKDPCNWCSGEKKGSVDCGSPGAISAAVVYGILWYKASPPRRYRGTYD